MISCLLLSAVLSAEPIVWMDGSIDHSGAPEGKLLTDNDGWWGDRVWTGVTYKYETPPTSPADFYPGHKETFGRRLLDGDVNTGWNQPVGIVKHPLTVILDFHRRCVFSEVDVISRLSSTNEVSVEVSQDGNEWTMVMKGEGLSAVTRLKFEKRAKGRYLRVSCKSRTNATTWIDELLAWGNAEVTRENPEVVKRLVADWSFPQSLRGVEATKSSEAEFQKFCEREGGGVVIAEVTGDPDRINSPCYDHGINAYELKVARNEVESRWFTVVNASNKEIKIPLKLSNFGVGIDAELLIGGIIRVDKPKRRLTEQERFDLLLTGDEPEEMFKKNFAALPYFTVADKPSSAFTQRYLANSEQVDGFPEAVPLRPSEAMVLMIRWKTNNAKPGMYKGKLRAGKRSVDISLKVADVVLPHSPVWVYAWNPFTEQYPFQSKTRFGNDVKAVLDLGVSHFCGLPKKGSKLNLAMRLSKSSIFSEWVTRGKAFHEIYNGKKKTLEEADKLEVKQHIEESIDLAKSVGLPLQRLAVELPDEPGFKNIDGVRAMAEYVREIHPELPIFCDPSFWKLEGRFGTYEEIKPHLDGFYNECVDISVPYRSNVECPLKRKAWFETPRKVNAQYAHPSRRAGRSIAWSSYRYGMNGFAYWAYNFARGNPWDIRTWKYYGYEALLVLPLENGVAITPAYEELREAYEDWQLLDALKLSGRHELLKELIAEFADSFDPKQIEAERPYKCDFRALRDKALQ